MTIQNSTSDAMRSGERCPFCDSRSNGATRWQCGTTGPDANDEYSTGTVCDKTVYRNGFLRCHDLLARVVDESNPMRVKIIDRSNPPDGFSGDGVVIPLELWEEIERAMTDSPVGVSLRGDL